ERLVIRTRRSTAAAHKREERLGEQVPTIADEEGYETTMFLLSLLQPLVCLGPDFQLRLPQFLNSENMLITKPRSNYSTAAGSCRLTRSGRHAYQPARVSTLPPPKKIRLDRGTLKLPVFTAEEANQTLNLDISRASPSAPRSTRSDGSGLHAVSQATVAAAADNGSGPIIDDALNFPFAFAENPPDEQPTDEMDVDTVSTSVSNANVSAAPTVIEPSGLPKLKYPTYTIAVLDPGAGASSSSTSEPILVSAQALPASEHLDIENQSPPKMKSRYGALYYIQVIEDLCFGVLVLRT
ncbi:hypothetical protein F5050DRAFT_1820305, partial [Lentinula boryana]